MNQYYIILGWFNETNKDYIIKILESGPHLHSPYYNKGQSQ